MAAAASVCFCQHNDCYIRRLKSFENFPSTSYMNKFDLAKAGFFYCNTSDIVTCFCCNLKLSNWLATDCPYLQHTAHSPNCKFLAKIYSKIDVIDTKIYSNIDVIDTKKNVKLSKV